jgi:hypothetical protein
MPSLKELMTQENVGILIYCGVVPIPDGVLDQVEKAEKAFERLGVATPERASNAAPSEVERTPRQRASMNNGIVAFLSTLPLTMRTPRQVWSSIKSANPKQTVESVTTRLKNNAGKTGLWIMAAGKYGMPGAEAATSTTKANPTTTKAEANVEPASAAASGEKLQPRVLAYIEAYPGCTKSQVSSAFKTSPSPAKANHVGVALARLRKSKRITDMENGPYWPLPAAKVAAKPTAAAEAAQPTA